MQKYLLLDFFSDFLRKLIKWCIWTSSIPDLHLLFFMNVFPIDEKCYRSPDANFFLIKLPSDVINLKKLFILGRYKYFSWIMNNTLIQNLLPNTTYVMRMFYLIMCRYRILHCASNWIKILVLYYGRSRTRKYSGNTDKLSVSIISSCSAMPVSIIYSIIFTCPK